MSERRIDPVVREETVTIKSSGIVGMLKCATHKGRAATLMRCVDEFYTADLQQLLGYIRPELSETDRKEAVAFLRLVADYLDA